MAEEKEETVANIYFQTENMTTCNVYINESMILSSDGEIKFYVPDVE